MQPSQPIEPSPFVNDQADFLRSFPFAYHLRMRNLLITFSPAYTSAMRRGFLRLRGFCAPSPVAQATVFRPAAVSPAPTFRGAAFRAFYSARAQPGAQAELR
jgi:hypothetical protein